MKKIVSFILVVAMSIPLVACTRNKDGSPETSLTSNSNVEDQSGKTADDLPKDLDFGGKEVRILHPSEILNEFYFSELPSDGNLVNQAVYDSNLTVQERLGVELVVTPVPGFSSLDDRYAYENRIKNSVYSQDEGWDFVAAMTGHMPSIVQSGVLTDLNKTKYLDTSKPYWLQSLVNETSVDGKLYFATGDASLSLAKQTMIILYNKELAANLGYADVQQTAINGEFTIELMRSMAKEAYSGDASGVDVTTDTFGFGIGNFNHLSAFTASLGLKILKKETNGSFTFTYGNDRATTVVQYLCEMFHTDPGFIISDNTGLNREEIRSSFLAGRMLFVSSTYAEVIADFREIADEFSVLPFPKWEAEEEYATFARNTFMSYGILTSCVDTEIASAVLECIASENYSHLTQTFYEDAMKVRYADSPMMKEVVGIITDSVKFDLGFTYSQLFISCDFDQLLNRSVNANDKNWMSTIAQRKRSVEKKLNEYITAVRDLK